MQDRAVNRSGWFFLLLLVFIGHAAGNLLFFKHGVLAHVFDENARMVRALFFNDLLFSGHYGWHEKWDAILHLSVPQGHSPLVEIFSALILEVLRKLGLADLRWMIWGVNTCFAALITASVYGIGRIVYGRAAGALAAFLLLCFPFIFAHSRVLMLDIPLMAMVSLTVLILLKTELFSSRKYSFWLGVCAALAELTKETAVIFLLPPAVYCFILASFRKDRRQRWANALITVLVTGAIAGFVYFRPENRYAFSQYFALAQEANHPSIGFYAFNFENFTGVWLGWLCLPLMALSIVFWRRHKDSMILFFWIFCPLTFYSLLPAQYPRYILPIFPAVALVSAGGLALVLPRRVWFWALSGIVISVALIQYGAYNAGKIGYTPKIKVPQVSYTVGRLAFHPEPLVTAGDDIFEILKAKEDRTHLKNIVGSLKFLEVEFDHDPGMAGELVRRICKDAGEKVPSGALSVPEAVTWLNETLLPFMFFFSEMTAGRLNAGQANLIRAVILTFSPRVRQLLDEQRWEVLVGMPEGQHLKRKILEALYPQQTPRKEIVLFLFNIPEIYGTVRLKCLLEKIHYDIVCPTEMYESGLALWPWKGDREEVLRADYIVTKSGETPRNFSKAVQSIEDGLKEGLRFHQGAFAPAGKIAVADGSSIDIYRRSSFSQKDL
ncbi:MAG: glycosyltransferase family 39 protein [Candidatus Omnitrophota bacterium]